MITISLCMIVRDEQDNLAACLGSVGDVADEIVIVDTGSLDRTIPIAREHTPNVYEFAWIDDFAAARNFAFSKATMEYILWLDADDRLLDADRAAFLRLKGELPGDVDCVMMRYNTGFDALGNVTFSFFRERLVRRAAGFQWHEPVHEYLAVGGRVINSEIAVTHAKVHTENEQKDRNLNIYEALVHSGGALSPRAQYYYARELMDHRRFQDAIARFQEFLDGGKGWVEDEITACLSLGYCMNMQGDVPGAIRALLMSFRYDTPRAEVCCRLGYLYKQQMDYRKAAFWFSLALSLKKPKDGWGFVRNDDWDYVPAIESAVCQYALGNLDEAERFNELAGTFKPESPQVAHNRTLFRRKREQEPP